MSLPVPLGVRFYSITVPVERWVTRWVDDISFRSVVPGGFSSATITIRIPRNMDTLPSPDVLGFSQLTELFRRVQVVDLRTAEVAWEGRVEDPARQVDPDTWQIGALGSMVAATDIQRPVFYVDSDPENWVDNGYFTKSGTTTTGPAKPWDNSRDGTGTLISVERADNTLLWTAGDTIAGYAYAWRWDSHGYDQAIARFTTTHDASGPSSTEEQNFSLVVGISSNKEIDVTGFETSGAQTKTNVIGTDFTDTNTRYIVLGARRDPDTSNFFISDATQSMKMNWSGMVVVGVRQDRNGNHLTTASSYPGDYVTVSQVVEDVVGRFLNGGWYELDTNTPLHGSVRGSDVYIDTSDTTQILHLIYPDGVTAADILNDMMNQVQTNAYWAIWESKWQASDPNDDLGTNSGFRFEWATWPDNYGYLVSSQDGFEGQPNGDDTYNFAFFRYRDTGDINAWHVRTAWNDDAMIPELEFGGFTRSIVVSKSDPTDGTTAGTLADDYISSKNKVVNAGTVTVRRPIAFYDSGANSASGAARMLDPWMIRPGKLVKIVDLPARQVEHDVAFVSAPDASQDGTIFRVVATEYNSSDNSCHMELDQVTRWQVPTQISTAASGTKTIRIQ